MAGGQVRGAFGGLSLPIKEGGRPEKSRVGPSTRGLPSLPGRLAGRGRAIPASRLTSRGEKLRVQSSNCAAASEHAAAQMSWADTRMWSGNILP